MSCLRILRPRCGRRRQASRTALVLGEGFIGTTNEMRRPMTKAGMPAPTVKVRDIMTEAVMFLNASQTQDDAWALLHTHGVSGAPVLGHGRLVGVLTRSDLG